MRRSTFGIAALGLALLGSRRRARRRGGRALQPGAPVQARGEHPGRDRRVRDRRQAAPRLRRRAFHAGQPSTGPGGLRQAAGEYEKTVKLQPKDADAHANLGAAYTRLKRSDEGIRELETALDLKPDNYEARLSLGFAYKQQGDYKHAIEHLQKATELKPDDPQGWTNLGVAKSKTDDKEGAIVALKKAIALKPDDADLHFDLGVVYRRQRNTDAAIAEYQVAVQKNPKLAKAYYDLGIMYSQERKKPRRGTAFEKYLEYGSHEDAGARKDAEERLKTFIGLAERPALFYGPRRFPTSTPFAPLGLPQHLTFFTQVASVESSSLRKHLPGLTVPWAQSIARRAALLIISTTFFNASSADRETARTTQGARAWKVAPRAGRFGLAGTNAATRLIRFSRSPWGPAASRSGGTFVVRGSGGTSASRGVNSGAAGSVAAGGRGGGLATGGTVGVGGSTGGSVSSGTCGGGTAQASDITIDETSLQQKITGFGVSSAWAGSYANASDADYLWSTTTGAGLERCSHPLRRWACDCPSPPLKAGVTVWLTPWGTGTNGAPGGSRHDDAKPTPTAARPAFPCSRTLKIGRTHWPPTCRTRNRRECRSTRCPPRTSRTAAGSTQTTSFSAAQLTTWIGELPGPGHGPLGREGHGARDAERLRVHQLLLGYPKRRGRLERRGHPGEPRIRVRHAAVRAGHRGREQGVLGDRGRHGNRQRRFPRRRHRQRALDGDRRCTTTSPRPTSTPGTTGGCIAATTAAASTTPARRRGPSACGRWATTRASCGLAGSGWALPAPCRPDVLVSAYINPANNALSIVAINSNTSATSASFSHRRDRALHADPVRDLGQQEPGAGLQQSPSPRRARP